MGVWENVFTAVDYELRREVELCCQVMCLCCLNGL